MHWDGRTSLHTSTTLRTLSTERSIDRPLHTSNYEHNNENHLAELTEQYRRGPRNITTDKVEYHLVGENWVVWHSICKCSWSEIGMALVK